MSVDAELDRFRDILRARFRNARDAFNSLALPGEDAISRVEFVARLAQQHDDPRSAAGPGYGLHEEVGTLLFDALDEEAGRTGVISYELFKAALRGRRNKGRKRLCTDYL